MAPYTLSKFQRILVFIYSIFFFVLSLLTPPKRKTIVFGGAPIIKFARWSSALKLINCKSVSLVPSIYSINSRDQFDLVWLDLVPKVFRFIWIRRLLAPGFAFLWVVRNARVVCSPVDGISFFGWYGLGYLELLVFRIKSIKVVTVTGGGDAYMLGLIRDPSLRIGLQASYPDRARIHAKVEKAVRRNERFSDLFITSQMALDGFARNDLITPHMGAINHPKSNLYMKKSLDLFPDSIKILHAPNHRHFKGTSFILNVIERIKDEGFKVDFTLLQKVDNSELMIKLSEAHIAIDQLIMPGYSNFAIEAMSLGIPTISNLGGEDFRKVMTRYSFLDECPLVHADPETLYRSLINLITNPKLRELISAKCYDYSLKRHSYKSWQNLWAFFEANNFDGRVISSIPNAGSEYQNGHAPA